MAKLVVNLTYKNQWGADGPTVGNVMVGNAVKKATINYLTKVVSPSTANEDKTNIELPAITAAIIAISILWSRTRSFRYEPE